MTSRSGGRRLVIEADGGSRGNPGPAGYGAVVRDADTEEVLAERAAGLGRVTNNVAEYRGLIAGLVAAREVARLAPVASVSVQMDSKLVVEQMSGRWKVKHPDLVPLAREAGGLVRELPSVTFRWIPRERNKHADRLANEAMDAQQVGQPWVGETAAALPLPGAPASTEPVPLATPGSFVASRAAQLPTPVGGAALPAPAGGSGWSAPTTAATTTMLVRHGQTSMSVDRRFSGRGDVPLTDLGREQAADAGRRLARRFDGRPAPVVLVSSPLARARDTAALIAAELGSPVTVDDRLIEADFGDWEGRTFAEIRRDWPDELAAWLGSADVAPPGGESFAAVADRVRSLRDDWVHSYGEAVLVGVSHVSPIKSLAQLAVEGSPTLLYRLHLDLCGVSEIDWYADGPASLKTWNALT